MKNFVWGVVGGSLLGCADFQIGEVVLANRFEILNRQVFVLAGDGCVSELEEVPEYQFFSGERCNYVEKVRPGLREIIYDSNKDGLVDGKEEFIYFYNIGWIRIEREINKPNDQTEFNRARRYSLANSILG